MKKLDINKIQNDARFIRVDKQDKRFVHCKVLIVCEGEKTEPNYFKSFELMKNNSDLVFEMDFGGGGINTMAVVDKAIELRNLANEKRQPFDAVWAVFDKDDFDNADFDNAINKANKNNIGCAWSNEAFELWYVYHFDNRNTAMKRSQYKRTITDRIRKNGMKKFTYKKNNPQMRQILADYGGNEELAIKYAQAQNESFNNKKYHTHNPATTVYKLVKLLRGEDKFFNSRIKKSVNAK